MRECITFHNCIRLTTIFHTVLNYSTTVVAGVVVWEFREMQGLVVLWSVHCVFNYLGLHLNRK